ncbi:MFS transporter [Arthrobacter ginkgonis]|uniref:MFS transporter n=1 Tax=Arthrobacter ginkgonis TaxID=1630594 RepID=A0ABP7CUC1_9MICC
MKELNEAPVKAEPKFSLTVSKRQTRLGTLIAFLAWVVAVYDFIMFGTLLPEIRLEFGWSEAQATGINTAIAVGTGIIVLAIGPIVDRIGRRRGMMATVGGTAVASALSAMTMNPAFLVGVRSVSGLGMAEQSINTTYLNEVYAVTEDEKIKKNRGFIYSIVQSGWPVGSLLAAGFIALLLPVAGWRGVFLLAALPAIILLWMRRSLKETPQYLLLNEARKLKKAGQKAEADELLARYGLEQNETAPLRTIFNSRYRRNTFFLSLVWILNFFGVTTFTVLGTTLLTDGKGLPYGISLLVFMAACAGGFLGYLFFGWLGQRFGRRGVVAAGFMISALAYTAMLFWAHDVPTVILFYALGQFFMAGPFSAFMFYMGEVYGADCRATGTSFLNAMAQPGSIIAGVLITVFLASGVSWITAAFVVGVVGVFLSGVAMLACTPAKELRGLEPASEPEVAEVVA